MINFYPQLHENTLATTGEYIFVIDRSGLLSTYTLRVKTSLKFPDQVGYIKIVIMLLFLCY